MNLQKSIVGLTALAIFSSLPAVAAVSLKAPLSCRVASANTSQFPIDSIAKTFSLNELANQGAIPFKTGFINFYGGLKTYDAYVAQSGMLVLATDPNQVKELHGTVFVTETSETNLDLDISIIHATRAVEQGNGTPVFVLGSLIAPPQVYKLNCVKVARP